VDKRTGQIIIPKGIEEKEKQKKEDEDEDRGAEEGTKEKSV